MNQSMLRPAFVRSATGRMSIPVDHHRRNYLVGCRNFVCFHIHRHRHDRHQDFQWATAITSFGRNDRHVSLAHTAGRPTTGIRYQWTISRNDTNCTNGTVTPDEPDAPHATNTDSKPPNETHTILDVSTYRGWDSIDAQETSSDDTGMIIKKQAVEWDPVLKRIVKKVVTTMVTQNPPSRSIASDGSTRRGVLDEKVNAVKDDETYDGKSVKLKIMKAQQKARTRAARNDPKSKHCKMCPICSKVFAGHKSMIGHLLYRDKCFHELDKDMKDFLIAQKMNEQNKRLRKKMRKKSPSRSSGSSGMNGQGDQLIENETNDDPRRVLRFSLKQDIPDSERTRIYNEKIRQINEKYTAVSTTNVNAVTSNNVPKRRQPHHPNK